MKKAILFLTVVICILGILMLAACDAVTPASETNQQQTDQQSGDTNNGAASSSTTHAPAVSPEQAKANAAVAEKTAALADYTFARGAEDDAQVEAREGDADMYIIATAEGEGESEKKLIYVYQNVPYDKDSAYRYVDVYMPTAKEKLDPETPVFLYLHGGGWVAGSRREEQLSLMPYIASTGMVVISMEYGLWFGLNQQGDATPLGVYGWESMGVMKILDTVLSNEHPVSVNDMMDDITTCLTFLRDEYLPTTLGLTVSSIGIGGYSAGGHLSSLYAYKHAADSPIPLAFLMDLVGPVKLLDENYMRLLDMLTGHLENDNGDSADLMELITPLLSDLAAPLAGILGEEEPIDISTEEGYRHALESISAFQPIDFLTDKSLPTIICYARQHDDIPVAEALFECEFDDFIPITVYQSISTKLDEVGIVHEDKLFDDLTHNSIGKDQASCKWMAANVAAFASLYETYTR